MRPGWRVTGQGRDCGRHCERVYIMWFLAWTRYNGQYTRIIASIYLEQ
jgi:hypothetical protein